MNTKELMSEEEQAYFKAYVKHLGEQLTDARDKKELIDILNYFIRKVDQVIKHDKSL